LAWGCPWRLSRRQGPMRIDAGPLPVVDDRRRLAGLRWWRQRRRCHARVEPGRQLGAEGLIGVEEAGAVPAAMARGGDGQAHPLPLRVKAAAVVQPIDKLFAIIALLREEPQVDDLRLARLLVLDLLGDRLRPERDDEVRRAAHQGLQKAL